MNFTGVFVEGTDWVGGRWQSDIVELDGAISDGGNEKRVVGLGPSDVVNAVSSVVRDNFGDGGREIEDVKATVAEDAEVLGGGNG